MDAASVLDIAVREEHFPRYDPAHGTPDPMIRRLITVRVRGHTATYEQTDYGHPGRFNPAEPRGIDAPLQGRAPELAALCAAIAPLLD